MARAQSHGWPQVMIFPEATTTNGRALVSFKTGAFAPGLPVQPVVVQYPHTRVDPAWVADGMSTPLLLLRLMTQPHNQMTVRACPRIFLPPAMSSPFFSLSRAPRAGQL